MMYRYACAALLCGLLAAPALGPAPAAAADLVIHGRIGNVFGGIDTRDGHRRHGIRHGGYHRDGWRRGHRDHRRDGLFDPRLDDDEFKTQLERRFQYETLFNDGGSFPEDRRRRALDGVQRPREERRTHRTHRRYDWAYPGVLLPETYPYPYADADDDNGRYDDGRYDDNGRYDDGRYDDGDGFVDPDGRERVLVPEAEPEPQTAVPDLPDARGPRFDTARLPVSPPAVGERLQRGKPHVALDWEDYDLPAPPLGQSYVRFEGAVLLIENATRTVRAVVWPPAG